MLIINEGKLIAVLWTGRRKRREMESSHAFSCIRSWDSIMPTTFEKTFSYIPAEQSGLRDPSCCSLLPLHLGACLLWLLRCTYGRWHVIWERNRGKLLSGWKNIQAQELFSEWPKNFTVGPNASLIDQEIINKIALLRALEHVPLAYLLSMCMCVCVCITCLSACSLLLWRCPLLWLMTCAAQLGALLWR